MNVRQGHDEGRQLRMRDPLNLGLTLAPPWSLIPCVDTVVRCPDPLCTHSSCWDYQLMMPRSYIPHWGSLWPQGTALPKITPLPGGSLQPRTDSGGDANVRPPFLLWESFEAVSQLQHARASAPTTSREAQCLVGRIKFWGYQGPPFGHHHRNGANCAKQVNLSSGDSLLWVLSAEIPSLGPPTHPPSTHPPPIPIPSLGIGLPSPRGGPRNDGLMREMLRPSPTAWRQFWTAILLAESL